jgi:hypothetical protein
MKNYRFWASPRQRLCLICSLLITSCTVLKPQDTIATVAKSYKMTIAMLPGEDRSVLYNALTNTVFQVNGNFLMSNNLLIDAPESELLTIRFQLTDASQLKIIQSLLSTNGIQIINLRIDD